MRCGQWKLGRGAASWPWESHVGRGGGAWLGMFATATNAPRPTYPRRVSPHHLLPAAMKQNGALQRPPLPTQHFNPHLKHSLSPFLPRQPHRNLLSTLQSILLSLPKSSSKRSFAMESLRSCVALMFLTLSISPEHAGCPSEDPNGTSPACPTSAAHLHIHIAHRARVHPPSP